jgi:hypothetical protein
VTATLPHPPALKFGRGNKSVVGLASSEGESFAFRSPVAVDGPVEVLGCRVALSALYLSCAGLQRNMHAGRGLVHGDAGKRRLCQWG